MKNENIHEIIIAGILVLLLVLFLNPFSFWMPSTVVYLMVGGLVVVFTLFAGLVWKEQAGDEREQLHKAIAGRVAYLVGMSVLVLGVLVQALTEHVDPWLILALGVMVLTKIVSLIYSQTHL